MSLTGHLSPELRFDNSLIMSLRYLVGKDHMFKFKAKSLFCLRAAIQKEVRKCWAIPFMGKLVAAHHQRQGFRYPLFKDDKAELQL